MNEEMQELLIANLTLDTTKRNNIAPLIVPQGDYGARVIRAKITDLGKPVNVESTAAVSIVATRSGDGESLAFSGKANEDGTVTVPVTQWMLDIPDEDVICHVVVTGNGYQYSTTGFLIEPQEKANPTEISADDPRADVVTEVLANENARQAAEVERQANESARKTAENARQSAETQRLTDEATRIANEAQRVSAEASRDTTFKSWANDIALLPDMSARISRNSKRLDGLEQRIKPSPFVFDETVAYQKDVPSNAVGAAAIHKIGGMTYKSKNLIPFPYTEGSRTESGVTITVNNDGGFLINGTATRSIFFKLNDVVLDAGTYTLNPTANFNLSTQTIQAYVLVNGEYHWGNALFTIAESATAEVMIRFLGGGGATNGVMYVMLNEGSTALPYEPYFEGLRSAKGTEVKSVGRNLIPFPYYNSSITLNGVTITVGEKGGITLNGKTTADSGFSFITNANNNVNGIFTLSAATSGSVSGGNPYLQPYIDGTAQTATYLTAPRIYNLKGNLNQLSMFWKPDTVFTNFVVYPMLNKGTTALPYTPYVEHTLPIPEELRPANGINAEVYDSIAWSKDGRVKTKCVKCGEVDLGTLGWSYDVDGLKFYASVNGIKRNAAVRCAQYKTVMGAANFANSDKSICAYYSFYPDAINVRDSTYTDAATFKAAMSGVMLVYELAEPIVTDISDLITSDNLLKIQALGTITAENEDRQAVPFTVEYITAESDE